jgi:hypothetical protein
MLLRLHEEQVHGTGLDDSSPLSTDTPRSPVMPNPKLVRHHNKRELPLTPLNGSAHSQPTSSKRRSKKSASFCNKVSIRQIPHINDLSQVEKDSTWLTDQDFLLNRKSCVTTVKKHVRGEITMENKDKYCFRGLESKTREGARRRKEMKDVAIKAVLQEQKLQKEGGIEDPESVKRIYRIHCHQAHFTAYELGLVDKEEADQIHADKQTEDKLYDVLLGL